MILSNHKKVQNKSGHGGSPASIGASIFYVITSLMRKEGAKSKYEEQHILS